MAVPGARRGRRRVVGIVLLVVALVAAGAGVVWLVVDGTGHKDASAVRASAPAGGPAMVSVRRQDIAPVLTSTSQSSAQPHYLVTSPAAGHIEYTRGLTTAVQAAQPAPAAQPVASAAPATAVPEDGAQPAPAAPATTAPVAAAPVVPKTASDVKAGEVLFWVDDLTVVAPADCLLQNWVSGEVDVPGDIPVAECTYPGFGLVTQIKPVDSYRILSGIVGAKGVFDDGPGPFDCPMLPATGGGDGGTPMVCLVPTTVRALAGVPGRVAIRSQLVAGALVVPRSAVRGLVDTGVVGLQQGNQIVQRTVKLGVTDGAVVQVIDGLSLDQQITRDAPEVGS